VALVAQLMTWVHSFRAVFSRAVEEAVVRLRVVLPELVDHRLVVQER
jgi:hypothetical protein